MSFSLETKISLTGSVNALAFSPCGRHLAAAVDDKVDIWDVPTWDLHCHYGSHTPVLSMVWDEGGRLFFGCESGHLSMISFAEKVCEQLIVIQHLLLSTAGISSAGVSCY
jgi:hypothetical protein